jgi:hypothetical protein
VPSEDEWPAAIAELGNDFRTTIGFVPNVVSNFALLPDHLVSWWSYVDDVMGGPSTSRVANTLRWS